jgi:hypothetical protein
MIILHWKVEARRRWEWATSQKARDLDSFQDKERKKMDFHSSLKD